MLSVAASPALSRLYAPSDFGLLSVYGSLVSIVAVVSSLAYNHAIPAPESDEEGANLTALSLTLVVLASILSAIIVVAFSLRLENYFGVPGFAQYVAMVPLGVLGLSAYETLSQWAARRKSFGLIAKTSVQRGALQTGIQLGGGICRFGTAGLVVGQLVGQWAGTVQIARRTWRDDAEVFRSITRGTLRHALRKYRRFPLFTLPGAMLNAIDSNSTTLLFAHFFGATTTGYFALGNRLIAIPFMLVGSSAQKVFYPAAAAAKHKGTLAHETQETFRRLLRVVLPIVSVMTVCAPELFVVLMGREWREAGVYMQWLSLRACFTMLVFPLTPLIFVLDRQAIGTVFSGVQLVVRVGAVCIGSHFDDPRLAVALLGLGTGVLWLGYLIYLLAASGNRVRHALRQLLSEGSIACAIASPIVVAKLLHASDWGVTLTAGGASALGTVLVLWRSLGR